MTGQTKTRRHTKAAGDCVLHLSSGVNHQRCKMDCSWTLVIGADAKCPRFNRAIDVKQGRSSKSQ